MDEETIATLEGLIRSEAIGPRIVLALKDVTLVGRDAIGFLGRCEANGITLKNCARYIREWIDRTTVRKVTWTAARRRKGIDNGDTNKLGR
jgi:hypothetical protein